jgi:hypothetical protein
VDSLKTQRPYSAPERYFAQLVSFTREQFLVDESQITEAHIMAFLEYCVNRPKVYRNSRLAEGPLRNGLTSAVFALSAYYHSRGTWSPVTRKVYAFAQALREGFGCAPRKAAPLSPALVHGLVAAAGCSPSALCTAALLLLLCETWCRPCELLWLDYPQCLRTAYNGGIVLVIPWSKVPLKEPRYEAVLHTKDPLVCAVCTLKRWIDFLGAEYSGPLFPHVRRGHPVERAVTTTEFTASLRSLVRKAGRMAGAYSSYSARRGSATTAAEAGWDFAAIQHKLWHTDIQTTFGYIETEALIRRMRSIWDP